jgi:hypothetical protein
MCNKTHTFLTRKPQGETQIKYAEKEDNKTGNRVVIM